MKPYLVELKVTAVVMANSEVEAMLEADFHTLDIVRDGEFVCDEAVEVTSLEHLAELDQEWDGECIPYGDETERRLKDILPESAPFVDTKTMSLFDDANASFSREPERSGGESAGSDS